jgi:hypothetical protein
VPFSTTSSNPSAPAEEPHPGDGADGGQGLAAEAERRDAEEVVGGGELAGGVGLEREHQFVVGDAVAVVGDAEQLAAALFDVHPDLAGAGVQGVLDELLHGAGGPLDHFPGRDLVDHVGRQHLDLRHLRQP